MEIRPVHSELPLLSRTVLPLPEEFYRIVTVLNQELKDRGLVFGLRKISAEEYEFSIYDMNMISK